MFRYEIYGKNGSIGHAEVEQDGLYWAVSATCGEAGEEILRLYAENGDLRVKLGVLAPEDGQLRLDKRLAKSRFAFDEQTRLTTDLRAGWQSFTGSLAGYPAQNGRLLRKNGGGTVAFAYDKDAPLPIAPLFRYFRLEEQAGRLYWMIDLDETGTPVENKTAAE